MGRRAERKKRERGVFMLGVKLAGLSVTVNQGLNSVEKNVEEH